VRIEEEIFRRRQRAQRLTRLFGAGLRMKGRRVVSAAARDHHGEVDSLM